MGSLVQARGGAVVSKTDEWSGHRSPAQTLPTGARMSVSKIKMTLRPDRKPGD